MPTGPRRAKGLEINGAFYLVLKASNAKERKNERDAIKSKEHGCSFWQRYNLKEDAVFEGLLQRRFGVEVLEIKWLICPSFCR